MNRFKARKNCLLFILILSVFSMIGCGGGEWTGHWLPGDQTAPTVTAVVPLNNAVNVAINTRITATFSEDMDPLTISTTTFTVQRFGPPLGPALAGTVTYNAATRTATFTPTIPATLTASTMYQATITTGAKDLVRNALAANYVWVFTTGAAPDTIRPRVLSTIPVNGSATAPTNAAITAIFTKNMAPATLDPPATSFTVVNTTTGIPVVGTVTYAVGSRTASFAPAAPLTAGNLYTATIKGTGASPATDTVIPGNALAGNQLPLPAASDYIWTFTPAAVDVTPPTVTLTAPIDLATLVKLNSTVNATFSKDMDPLTLSTATFTLQETGPPLGPILIGTVTYAALTRIATFTPTIPLLANTNYTATVTNGAKDLAGNALVVPAVGGLPKPNPWTFATGTGLAPGAVDLGLASTFGTFGGSAGMTNTGNLTLIDGDIGTISTGNATITGFHEKTGDNPLLYDNYTDTLGANSGAVAGEIYTCTNSTTGPNSAVNLAPATANAADCALATQARLDAQTAYIALAAMPSVVGSLPGNLAGLTLAPGVYNNATSVLLSGGNVTLDAQGDANAVFVFQIGTSLTVGDAAVPRSVILTNGAQAKNVFWQVGTAATINPSGGGTMEGTIIANSGVVFSTAGPSPVLTLNGRALSLISSVTMVNTVINVPLP